MVGGGINGAVSAAALVNRGLKVTVIDRADFASTTSQESSNLAWGGIKYLESYELKLVWKLCRSRNRLMKAYPSQVQEIRFHTQVAQGFRKPCWLLYLGALLYWFIGGCKTRPPRYLRLADIQRNAAMVKTDNLASGVEYSDAYFVNNDARFTFSFIRKVLQKNGNAINYMELTAAEWINNQWYCTLHDHLTDESIELKARTLVNAGGPYTDYINSLLHIDSPYQHIFSKGAHIIVPQITRAQHVLTFFASDGRLFFMIPMGDRTCIGTTDTRVDFKQTDPTPDDVQFLLDNANALLELEKPLTHKDIIATRCGVRPLAVQRGIALENSEWSALSRKHIIDVHPEQHMCSIYGGKLTDCINIGEEIDAIITSFGLPLYQALKPWYGEPSAQKKRRFLEEANKLGLSKEQGRQLWTRYGKDAFSCLERIRRDSTMADPLLCGYLRAELHHIADNEMVVHLEDFLRRRTQLEQTVHRATLRCDPDLPEAAFILFGKHAEEEIADYFNEPRASIPISA